MPDIVIDNKTYYGINTIKMKDTNGEAVLFGLGSGSTTGTYTITFMANGIVHTSVSVVDGLAVTIPSRPIRDGYYFTGWYTAETNGELISFPYTPTSDVTLYAHYTDQFVLGFTGLSESSGVLTWTDDVANSEGYSTTVDDTLINVTSPLDSMFPFCDIEEFTDNSGNVFVKFPKCWIKFINNDSGYIDGFKISNVQAEEDMFIPDCFLNPVDKGESYLDYFALGKYEMSGSSTKGYSASNVTCLVNITRANARKAARAYGASDNYYNGYQLEDFSMLVLYNFLCMLYYKTANIQTVFGGRTGSGTTSNWSGASVTGTCDNLTGMNGWNTLTDCVKMLGIENPYGNVFKWIDGVYFSGSTIYAHRLPQDYADSATNASSLGFARPTTFTYISALKSGTSTAVQSYVYSAVNSGSATTYVGDYNYYSSSGVVLYAGGSWSSASNAGLWYLNGGNAASSSASGIGARLSYRPL